MPIDSHIITSIDRFHERILISTEDASSKVQKLHQLFNIIVYQISDQTQVLFTSSFARLSYIAGAYNIDHKSMFLLHAFRKSASTDNRLTKVNELKLGFLCVSILLSKWLNREPTYDRTTLTDQYRSISGAFERPPVTFMRNAKVALQHIDLNKKRIVAQLYDEPFSIITITFDIADRNEDYTALMESVVQQDLLPLSAQLINIEIHQDNTYAPSSIVLEPDLLYTVTSIADCFGAFTSDEVGYLLKKFSPMPSSLPLIVGNVVNYFLDQMMYYPELTFKELTQSIFSLDPIGIALLSDDSVRDMIQKLATHYQTIRDVVQNQLEDIGINRNNGLVEPSFYSAKYGIQGRLDLFASTDNGITILELKSGSPFKANTYGLSNTHYHQTLLYDMLIESVFGTEIKRNNFILYSKETHKPLRFAPALKGQQRETIKARNRLYLHDRALAKCPDILKYLTKYINKYNDQLKGYQKTDIQDLMRTFDALTPIERSYVHALIQFAVREWLVHKVGHRDGRRVSGLSTLWTLDINSKMEQFNILNQLTLDTNKSDSDDPILIFAKSHHTALISNFRKGDLGVLYPYKKGVDAILKGQVFKVTILTIESVHITIRLRSRQENAQIFRQHTYWNIEHDSLDRGYTEMTRSVYEWSQASLKYRRLIMGLQMPARYEIKPVNCHHQLTSEQSQILSEIISAHDYYLLWGPPGTGKTSVMLKEIVRHYLNHSSARILILAYTNRAVDEICHAICSIDPQPSLIRIGSRYSTGEPYLKYLLSHRTASTASRKALKSILTEEQIYVGTVASVLGKKSIFDLIQFDIAIIDEASQILEQSMIGLLSRVKRFILIGDHQQLPAIVQQDASSSQIKNSELRSLGFDNLNNSLFERMFRAAKKNRWDHAYGQLTYQGRMHKELMAFPSKHFYQNRLRVLPVIPRLTQALQAYTGSHDLSKILSQHRLMFVPSQIDTTSDSIKVNVHEAHICAAMVSSILEIYNSQGRTIDHQTLGIITPYRAQIAQIKQTLSDAQIPHLQKITIDTVERYQGGARDIIIMSTCINYAFQMSSLVSLSEEGVDRKLNVALTRVREQFILIGNPNLLRQNNLYNALIKSAKKIRWVEP